MTAPKKTIYQAGYRVDLKLAEFYINPVGCSDFELIYGFRGGDSAETSLYMRAHHLPNMQFGDSLIPGLEKFGSKSTKMGYAKYISYWSGSEDL